jgi:hypothetical protein
MLYHRIRKKFIKLYLKECLEEFLALGGLKKIIIRRKLPAGHSLPEPLGQPRSPKGQLRGVLCTGALGSREGSRRK